MAVTGYVYGLAMQSILNKEIDFDTDTVKVMLATSSYTPAQDTHRYASSLTGFEITGTGYTAGGATLASKTVTYDTATNTLTLDCADPQWTNATITARYAIFYVSTGTASTSPLICYWDLGQDESVYGDTFTLQIPSAGLLTLSTAV